MKSILILFITALLLPNIESNTYNLQLKDVISTEVCVNGYFVLDAELNMPIKDPVTLEYLFKILLRNNGGGGYTSCFLIHFEGQTAVKVGCIAPNWSLTLFQVLPSTLKTPYNLYGHTINLLPYSLKTPFQVSGGSQLDYYSTIYEIKMNFAKAEEESTLEFYLISKTSSTTHAIYLDDIKIECTVKDGKKLICPVTAKNLIQERNHIYQANLIDSKSKIKKNHFVNPIEVTLQYIK